MNSAPPLTPKRRLRAALVERGWYQYHLALLADMTETDVSRILTGRRAATADERQRLAEVLGKPEDELFGGEVA